MSRIRNFLTDSRTLAIIGAIVVAGLIFLDRNTLKTIGYWAVVALIVVLFIWFVAWLIGRFQSRLAARKLDQMVLDQVAEGGNATPAAGSEAAAMRERMQEAIKAIKSSKLGHSTGANALYELPWYMVIGNPAAGKSTAVVNSGLKFPFADNRGNVIQGLGGTRNCDWYFTTEGILLDTAGRYSVHEEDRDEWLGFLSLLKKNRPRAPINGIIIAASIPELISSKPDFVINLAKNLRQRVQELTEHLEIFAPVYVVFTKVDLVAGFIEFFRGLDESEREKTWGATMPYDRDGKIDATEAFDQHFDHLYEGLKEMSLVQLALNRGRQQSPGLLTLPLEFANLKPALRVFIATLFEENPYQFKPIFRGFYLTSALQEGVMAQDASERIATRFNLQQRPPARSIPVLGGGKQEGYFLLELFRKVIFADRQLVRQYSAPNRVRTRYAVFFGSALGLGLAFAGWMWSYSSNRQLIENVEADFQQAIKLQKEDVGLKSQLDAMVIIKDRLQQLVKYREDHPLTLGLGLYQGGRVEKKLRQEYFAGMRQLMLQPVSQNMESYLSSVVANASQLKQPTPLGDTATTAANISQNTGNVLYQNASPTDTQDAYNALKAYLMLNDRSRIETGHLTDQITRFWRVWLEENRGNASREEIRRRAEGLMAFHMQLANDPEWPVIESKVILIDDTRQALNRVMRGMPARDRVYAEIKSRAATRYNQISIADMLGSEQRALSGSVTVPGPFTKAAWDNYVKQAIDDAANKELKSTDWVLGSAVEADLTLAGSPEHIQKELTSLYKNEYARAWAKFMQGVTVNEFGSFDQAVSQMDRMGDTKNSPLLKLMDTVYAETAWDNPASAGMQDTQNAVVKWFKQYILRQAPSGVVIDPDKIDVPIPGQAAIGPIGKEFSGLARLMVSRESNPSMMKTYMESLGKIRGRLNQIKTQGDPGPGARQFLQQTLDGNGSEVAEASQYVESQMLVGLTDSQRDTLRPILLRPLMQTITAMVKPTEVELNRIWAAQVYQPFERNLGQKFPFNTASRVEATSAEIAQIFGPDGAIAKFSTDSLGALVIRRGNSVTARDWLGVGIHLSPELKTNFALWIDPQGTGGVAASGAQDIFEVRPSPATGAVEYTLQLGDQVLRYRNTATQWTTFIWERGRTQGASITATGYDGQSVQIANFSGDQALNNLIESATKGEKVDGAFNLTWSAGSVSVPMLLKVVSSAQASGDGNLRQNGLNGLRLPLEITAQSAPAPGVAVPEPTTAVAPAAGTTP
jgi:type VI secretion system protein ImpL